MIQIPDLSLSKRIYDEAKFWGPAVVAIWFVFNAISWIKDLKDNHLAHIQEGINNFNTKLDDGLQKQTEKIVAASNVNTNEVKELRGDVKLLTSAILTKSAPKRRKK